MWEQAEHVVSTTTQRKKIENEKIVCGYNIILQSETTRIGNDEWMSEDIKYKKFTSK